MPATFYEGDDGKTLQVSTGDECYLAHDAADLAVLGPRSGVLGHVALCGDKLVDLGLELIRIGQGRA
jgi:hypothetical protein